MQAVKACYDSDMGSSFEEKQQKLLDDRVAPWVAKLPWAERASVAFDASEGYAGNGIMGAKAGPWDSIDFENVAHEMAHAIEILECGRVSALTRPQWGLDIKTQIHIGHQTFREPVTMQATEREARVCGIQLRLLEMVEHPAKKGFVKRHAAVLHRWMPDSIFGGSNEEERLALRERLIKDAFIAWPQARVASAWMRASQTLESIRTPDLKAQERARPRKMGR